MFSQGRFDPRVVFVGGEFVNLFGVLPISAKSVCRNFCCFSLLAFVTFTSMLAANLSCIHHVQMYRIRLVMEDIKMYYDCENGLRCKGYSRDWFHKINSYYRTIYCQPQNVLSLRVCAHCLVRVHAVVYVQWSQKAFWHLKINEFHCIKLSGRSILFKQQISVLLSFE